MPLIIVYGGQFGDEGKGKISQWVARKYNAVAVVRVGGSQADHTSLDGTVYNVLPTSARERCSILPSGSYIVLERLLIELTALDNPYVMIDESACIITRENRNQSQQSGRMSTIGSHGLGVRSAVHGRLRGEFSLETLPSHYDELLPYIGNTRRWLAKQLANGEYVVIEGPQGYGLSNHLFDMHPYVTSRTITPCVFCCESGVNPAYTAERIMCLRTFPIRVAGESGPLPKEITWQDVTTNAKSTTPIIECPCNTGRVHRVARFDSSIVRRAILETQPTKIVLNMIDYVDANCVTGRLTNKALKFVEEVESSIQSRIDYIGFGRDQLLDRVTGEIIT